MFLNREVQRGFTLCQSFCGRMEVPPNFPFLLPKLRKPETLDIIYGECRGAVRLRRMLGGLGEPHNFSFIPQDWGEPEGVERRLTSSH
jgi:hypothetical protein